MKLQKIINAEKKRYFDCYAALSISDPVFLVEIDSESLVNQVAIVESEPGKLKKIVYRVIAPENSSINYILFLDIQGTVELSLDALLKKSSSLSYSIFYILQGGGSLTINALLTHEEASSKSLFLAKGIVADHGKSNVLVKTVIKQQAINADALQTIKHLLLGDHATVVAMPILEALSDQIICKHGSSIGSFDADALFFLQSKGFDNNQAKELLLSLFLRN
jgi:hypothetical protein